MTATIFGCGGGSGGALLRRHEADGTAVLGLGRSVGAGVRDGVELARCDIRDPAAVRARVADRSTVYHCANVPYHLWARELEPMLEGLIEGTRGRQVHIVYLDNYYAYGDVEEPLSEDSPYRAVSAKGALRARLARRLEAHADEPGERVSIVRAGDLYGPGVVNATFGERAYAQIAKGKDVSFPVAVEHPHCFNFVDDVARALKLVGESRAEADGGLELWHVPHAGGISPRELVELCAEAAGTTATARRMPRALVKLLALAIKPLGEFEEIEYEFDRAMEVRAERLAERFAFSPTPHARAARETMSPFLENPS